MARVSIAEVLQISLWESQGDWQLGNLAFRAFLWANLWHLEMWCPGIVQCQHSIEDWKLVVWVAVTTIGLDLVMIGWETDEVFTMLVCWDCIDKSWTSSKINIDTAWSKEGKGTMWSKEMCVVLNSSRSAIKNWIRKILIPTEVKFLSVWCSQTGSKRVKWSQRNIIWALKNSYKSTRLLNHAM